jgi:hypothetical protein
MKTINLNRLVFTNEEIGVMVEILNKNKRRNLYINQEIIIEQQIEDVVIAIEDIYKNIGLRKHISTRTEIFAYLLDTTQKHILRKRVKELFMYYDINNKKLKIIIQ